VRLELGEDLVQFPPGACVDDIGQPLGIFIEEFFDTAQ